MSTSEKQLVRDKVSEAPVRLLWRGRLAGLTEPTEAALAEPAFGRRNLTIALALWFVASVSIIAFEGRFHIGIRSVSDAPQFLYQAEAFLHGHWDIALPPSVTDVVVIHGKDYIVYPPFPAILMMPFVAIFGLATSDVLFTAVIASFNLPLIFLLLEQVRANGLTRRVCLENIVIALLAYYGSINLWLSLGGRMWFTAHIVSFTCVLLSLILAFRRHYGWSAVLLTCAFWSRSTILLGFPFLFYLAWQDAGASHDLERFASSLWKRMPDWTAVPWRRLIPPAVVTGVMLVLFMIRNALIFGLPLDTGYAVLIQQHYPIVTTGPFCVCYVPANVVANFFTFPHITFSGPFDRHPAFEMLNNGIAVSVFITTPLFLLLFWRNRTRSLMRAALWVTLGLLVVAVLLFHASGWYQFGARYLFDGYAYAFLLLALTDVRVDWRFALLGILGVIINVLGAHQFWTNNIFHL
ncbi:MAG TPA: hypothetical protein VGS80_07965 [Ktedonobacterales bacterium]|nr:hypothetical protein [Ktedonobacterales bacterium]